MERAELCLLATRYAVTQGVTPCAESMNRLVSIYFVWQCFVHKVNLADVCVNSGLVPIPSV